MRFLVVGGGSWGTAFTHVLLERGHDVVLACHTAEQADTIAATGRNPRYLTQVDLSAVEPVEGAAAGDAPRAGYAPGMDELVWWLNAADPASLCGLDLPGLKAILPSRLSSTHVVFRGAAVVLVSRRRGRELEIRVPPDAPCLAESFSFVKVLTARDARPMSAVHVETINDEPALASPYKGALLEAGFVEDYRRLTYQARP